MAARLRGPSSTTCRGRVLSRSQVRPRHAAPSGSTQRGGDKETGCRWRHRKQVLCGGRATPSLERWGVRQIPRAEVRRVRGRRQAEVWGAQTQPAPSAHRSSLLTGGLPGKSRPREDRATHRGGPRLQQVSSGGRRKVTASLACGAPVCRSGNWENAVCTRRHRESPARHVSSPEAPVPVHAPGAGRSGGPARAQSGWAGWRKSGPWQNCRSEGSSSGTAGGGGVTVNPAMAPNAERGTGMTTRRRRGSGHSAPEYGPLAGGVVQAGGVRKKAEAGRSLRPPASPFLPELRRKSPR